MTAALVVLAVVLATVLAPITFVQVLYLESLRLRSRELPALEFFKKTLEGQIGLKGARGALVFSLLKHTILVALGVAILGATLSESAGLWRALAEAALLAWAAMLAGAYIVPQTLYRKTDGRWVRPLVPGLRLAAWMVRPVIAVLEFFQAVVELADHEESAAAGANHAEHIEALISAGAEEGIIGEEDRELIQAAVEFGDKTVREVMTPRPNIVAIEASRTLEDLRQLVIHEQYSRIPVYEGTIDQIIGFVHVRDMFELDEPERRRRTVRELVRPVRLVPETKPVRELMREMQEDRAHMAIVVDEYGNTAGLATMEDLVEEILGEIRDEHEPELDATPEPDGAWVVSGSCDVDRLRELFGFRPDQGIESTTVGGLVAEWAGHVPQPGEVVERDGIRLEVLAADERRVEQLRVRPVAIDSHDSGSG
ncbi:MAG: hemolysin family protein [Bryobacterales bacterium]|nr:hemolysin family protein [Bryobacteraceae bacterium]MDW8354667.1 hemolysin family protein [Bryobacterales bacterium]